MPILKIYDLDDNLLTQLNVTQENSYNKILKRKKSILDLALDNRIEMYYGCMGGSCSACICEIISGEEFIDKEGLHEQIYKGISQNEILTCIATIKDNLKDDDVVEIRTKF